MGFGLTGSCYDVARPDSLMLFLALSGLVLLRFTAGTAGALGSAVLLSLAFFTKQHAAWFVLAALVHLMLNERRRLTLERLHPARPRGWMYSAASRFRHSQRAEYSSF